MPAGSIRLVFFILLFALGCNRAQAAEFYTDADLFWYSEPVSIESMIQDWGGPFYGGTTALTHNIAEIGFGTESWQFSVLTRYDYEMEFSPDTAEFYYLMRNELPLPVGRTYRLDLVARQTVSDGLRVARQFRVAKGFDVNVGLSYLKGRRLTDGTLRGNATAIGAKDYDYSFLVDYFYSEDKLFDRPVSSPSGDGYSIDLGAQWQLEERLRATVTLKDFLARILWHDAPYTIATGTSDVKTYDANGYVVYDPLVSGFEGNRDFIQTLPRRGTMRIDYDWNTHLRLSGIVDYTPPRTFYRLGVGALQTKYGEWSLLYYLNEGAVNVGFNAPAWSIALTTDSTDINRARTLGLVARYAMTY